MIAFRVPSVPTAQPRQRHRVVTIGGKPRAVNYTPARHPVNAFKAAVQHAFASGYEGPPLDGPLRMRIVCVFPRPKSKTWKRRPMPREPYTARRADWDNVGKAVSDALNGLAWRDDGQLADVRVERWIAAGDERPRVEVRVERMEAYGG